MNFRKKALFNCDALALLEHLPSEVVALTYLNPPYCTNSNLEQKTLDEYAFYLAKIAQQSRRVLINEGSLFVHWSQNSPIDVRLMMNQVFSKEPNYEITWYKKHRGPSVSQGLRVDNELILIYSKSDRPILNKLYRPLSSEEASSFHKKDERGLYKTTSLTRSSDRPSLQRTWRGYQLPPQMSWCFTLDKLDTLAQENRIHFPNQGLPQLKLYLNERLGVEIGMTWDDIPNFIAPHECMKHHFAQMPLTLMERIIKIGSNPENLILDPFCGTGTTLVAAQSLNRYWWGVDNSVESNQITIQRLFTTHSLKAAEHYDVLNENDILQLPIIDASYADVVIKVGGISELQVVISEKQSVIVNQQDTIAKQQDEIIKLKRSMEERLAEIAKLEDENVKLYKNVEVLTDSIFELKKLMNISDNDDEKRVEDVIKDMEDFIKKYIANQSTSIESYKNTVCAWLTGGWERLDDVSQSFLPQAELLFDIINQTNSKTNSKDYSPFIIQYCRALENELLIKLFKAYTDHIHNHDEDINSFLDSDRKNKTNKSFCESLKNRSLIYTLGQMTAIMDLLQENRPELNKSVLLKDFRKFTLLYFSVNIVDKKYLDQIRLINGEFRRKAAHPYILNAEAAEKCREQVRSCLNELILNYSGKPIV